MIDLEILLYLIVANIIGFIFMGIDKRKAKKGEWRLPERTLWGIAILGGAIGSLLGMKTFRHKTKHRSFVIGLPLIIIFQVVFFVYINVFLS
ncbi:DUF1294 domain-containing protein [Ornithinibacillus salinisoli]|uniref:DUF1294 domain-containing protein n=1 Tax=Ornithinibacillus salinisoli TaxID=1848459 RepID=A0ABW4W611_9BACI